MKVFYLWIKVNNKHAIVQQLKNFATETIQRSNFFLCKGTIRLTF